MSTYLRDARHHAEKIERFHKHAGTGGYAQARHHDNELSALLIRAHNSKKGKSDVPVIQAIIQNIRPMMDEMLKRESESDA